MATAKNPFSTAHYEKIKLTSQTVKKIRRAYKSTAQEIQKKLANLELVNPSDSLKKLYYENLLKDVSKSVDSLNRLVRGHINVSSIASSQLIIDATNRQLKSIGLGVRGAYSYIPRQEVRNILSGRLYGSDWSLSQAIWKNGSKMKSDIETVVSKGLIENKPTKEIADDLVKYVNPSAKKSWDWSKVYPGTSVQVDYNAQRLARTMIQHSFQTTLVRVNEKNPFCRGIIWYSEDIPGRTCQLCAERDGMVFPVRDLPLDHPNGLCYFEPVLEDAEDIADRLADWAEGEADPDLDGYVLDMLG